MSVDKICSKIYPDQAGKRQMCIKKFSPEISSSFEKKVCYETASSYVLPKKGISLFECIESHYTPIIKKALDNSQGCKVSAQKKTECKKNAKETVKIVPFDNKEKTECETHKNKIMFLIKQLDIKVKKCATVRELGMIIEPILDNIYTCMNFFAITEIEYIQDVFVKTFNLLQKNAGRLKEMGEIGRLMSDDTNINYLRCRLYTYLNSKRTRSQLKGDLERLGGGCMKLR